MDTGVDRSVLSHHFFWPKNWPFRIAPANSEGIGHVSQPAPSAPYLLWEDQDGNSGVFKPYVLASLPVNLWEKDVFGKLGLLLMTLNSMSSFEEFNQGFLPGDREKKKIRMNICLRASLLDRDS